MGKRISSVCTEELVKTFESTNEGQDTSCEPSHLSIDNAPHQEWRKVPEDKKENLWKIITGKFAFESPNSEKKRKRRIMRDISHKWKSWKCELRKSSYDPSLTIDEIIAFQTDKRVDTFQFKNLVTSWFTEDKHLINQYLLQKAVVKFVDAVEEAIPGLNMSTVMSHMNMKVDTISDIDIRNNSLNDIK
ncbi:hypothetical protein Tco_0571136, partial [Tanacetum coccineum]